MDLRPRLAYDTVEGFLAASGGNSVQVTLEEAFMELTHDSVQYRTDTPATTRSLHESAA